MNKKGFEMNFSWMFAIMVGVIILFLAVFFATQILEVGEQEINTKTAKALGNILNPLLTSLESGKSDSIPLNKETRIYTSCSLSGDFGSNSFQVSEKTDFGGREWSDRGVRVSAPINQYLFSEEMIETKNKELYFLIMPFNMPFKVGDIMVWHTKQYCFVGAPREIEQEIRGLAGERNLAVEESLDNCNPGSVKVCFERGNGCDILVKDECNRAGCKDFEEGRVVKDGSSVFYVGNLMYGAIFSSEENYECGVNRLIIRLNKLSKIYKEKAQMASIRGCGSGLMEDIDELIIFSENYQNLEDLRAIKIKGEEIERKNEENICELF
jgi:hypothetical protein